MSTTTDTQRRPLDWSVLVRPGTLAAHVVVAAAVVTCVALGQWQLERLAVVRANNELVAQRSVAEPVDLLGLLTTTEPVAGDPSSIAAVEFRRVVATGVLRRDEELLHRNRSLGGRQGYHVVTPLELDDGTVVLVVRGWVPANLSVPPVAEARAPEGRVSIVGLIERSVAQPRFGARDPETGALERVFHLDTSRLDGQVEGALRDVIVRAEAGSPGVGVGPTALPAALGPPELSEGNHRSYAVQWFVFAVIALGAHGAWLSTRLRARGAAQVS